MPLDIFFSYASDDAALVRRIKDGIESRSDAIDIYIYESDPQPGESISRKAKDGIRRSDILLVLLTPNSRKSIWVQQEVGFADGTECPIVPVLNEGADPPTGILGDVEYLTFDEDDPEEFFETFLDYVDIEPDKPGREETSDK